MATFVRIAEAGNISRAARSLGLSVGMASRHLSWLEHELGAALMRRTTRSIQLTPAGRDLLVRASAILSGVAEAREAMRPGRGAAGRVVLAAQPAFGLVRLAPLIPSLLARHPRLQLELRFLDRRVDFVTDGVDVGILTGVRPPKSASLALRRLGTYEIAICAAPKLADSLAPIRKVSDLERAPCVVLDTGPATWSFATGEAIVARGRVHTNDLLATRELVRGGVGVAWLPVWLADEDLRSGRLVRILPDAAPPTVEVFALYPRESRELPAVRAVLDHAIEGLGQEKYLPGPRRSRAAGVKLGA
jgi:DNA-binding transcriptional LysR family regulator